VSAEYLRLTAYFGERARSGRQFTVDAMLDLFGAHGVDTAVALRGIAGFGPRHDLRTDVSLSLSEDPPIVVIAVDTAARLAPLTDAVTGLVARGLVTVEAADRPAELTGAQMQLTVFLGRGARTEGRPSSLAAGEVLRSHGLIGGTVYVGVDGTARGRRQRAEFFSRNLDVPAIVAATGPRDAAVRAAAALGGLPGVHTMTAAPAQVCKVDGRMVARPAAPADAQSHQRLVVQTASSRAHQGVPVHRALVAALRGLRLNSGVTVVRAAWGFHGDGPPMADRMFQLGRHVPVTTTVVDTPDNITRAFDVAEELTEQHGLITCAEVPAAVSIDDGRRRGRLR
jgi:PII-like signaling protein